MPVSSIHGALPRDSQLQTIQVVPFAQMYDGTNLVAAVSLAARATTTATITTSASHGFAVGQRVVIALATGPSGFAALNGTYVITATATGTTFTYTTTTSGTVTSGAATGTATASFLSTVPTGTTSFQLVFPPGSFTLIVIPTAAADATYNYVSESNGTTSTPIVAAGTFPLYQNVSNVIAGTEGDVVSINRTTTTPIAFLFCMGK